MKDPFDRTRLKLATLILQQVTRQAPANTDYVAGAPVFSFCKTEHMSYDLAVQVALIVFHHHLGQHFRVSSDGADADWAAARRLCQLHLGYGDDFQLDS